MTDTTMIKEGMLVYDKTGEKIGTVDDVRFGDEDVNQPGPETTSVPDPETPTGDFVTPFVLALTTVSDDNIPQEIKQRLKRYGYFKLNTGKLFESDYFVTLSMVTRVHGEHVHLNTTKDDFVSA